MAAPSPAQIRDDLRGLFRGRLGFDAVRRALFATDASPFAVTPLGVAVPADAADLQALVKYAQDVRLPLVPRGAGTGLAGESLGPGLVVDLAVSFRDIAPPTGDTVTAGAGATLAEVNAVLAAHGRRFAPDPASAGTCTVGGVVATNASGGNAFRFGYTRDHVAGLRVVWDDGSADEVRGSEAGTRTDAAVRTVESHAQTSALLAGHRELIQLTRPQTRFNRCGYVLHDVLTPAGIELPRLLTGSEGTLALVTAATLRTIPRPAATGHAVLGFPTMEAAARAGLVLRAAAALVACDLLDARQLAVSRADAGIGPVPTDVGAALLLTFEADSEHDAVTAGRDAVESLANGQPMVVLAGPTCDPAQVEAVRRFRQTAVNGLYALGPGPRPVAFVEDIGVPPEELPRFLAEVRAVLRKFDLAGSVLVHVPSGVVHTRPFVDLESEADRAKLWPLAEALHGVALALGGTVSAQHGTGIARTPWVEKQYGPLMPVFRELKRVFDPAGILNPGKIIGPDPSRPAWPLRGTSGAGWPGAADDAGKTGRIPLLGSDPWAPATAQACNGCGECRTRTAPVRMCPVFRATADEAATPRAKANLVRHLLAPDPADPPAPEDVRAVADLCVNCKMCRTECRAGVDVPRLMLAAKAADYAERGLDRQDWVLARVEFLAAVAGNFAFTTNRILGNRPARWVIEKLFGLSRKRTLPRFTHRTFLRRARRNGLTQKFQDSSSTVPTSGVAGLGTAGTGNVKLAYFVDIFANYNDPLTAEATVAVLKRNGFEVHVPPGQRGSGTPPLAAGDVDTAREVAARNVRVLADLVRDGYTVICSEPTAAVALTQDYLDLLPDPDAKLVAANTVELTAFLGELHAAGKLDRDFRRLDVTLGHHVPCHLKALGGLPAGPRLLELIPGVRVRTIDVSCSGMAGTWGLRADHYAASLEAGRPMLDELNRPGVLFGSSECGTCRMQMQEGTGKRALHPVQYLALAYGLVPEIEARLLRPVGKLVD